MQSVGLPEKSTATFGADGEFATTHALVLNSITVLESGSPTPVSSRTYDMPHSLQGTITTYSGGVAELLVTGPADMPHRLLRDLRLLSGHVHPDAVGVVFTLGSLTFTAAVAAIEEGAVTQDGLLIIIPTN